MGKVYPFEKFKIRQKIKDLQHTLDHRNQYGEKNGYLLFDHFTILNLRREIVQLENELTTLDNAECNTDKKN